MTSYPWNLPAVEKLANLIDTMRDLDGRKSARGKEFSMHFFLAD